ncbi:hypothetical protein GCM10022224_044100 [Nonomuraea antimicrobica]|uniref:Uncharacterized protein n=1 Tax=Nonomuraea antimicrobica TaxID=561173 RepID=A0ABP7C2B4_9ACTN
MGILETFYHRPHVPVAQAAGARDIYDPVDNIIAGVRYAVAGYGSVSNVPGVVGMKTGGGYQGY